MKEKVKKHVSTFFDIFLTLITMMLGVVGMGILFRLAYESVMFGWHSAGDFVFYLFS